MVCFPVLAECWEKNVQIRDGPMSQPSSMSELPPWKKGADLVDVSADREGHLSSGRVFGLTLASAVTPTEVLVTSVQHGI